MTAVPGTAGAWRSRCVAGCAGARGAVLAVAVLCAVTTGVSSVGALAAAESAQVIPLFTSASDPEREGFARVINHSERGGTVRIVAIDDTGKEYGPIELSLGARESAHFNSRDLEKGNASKGLSDGLGAGQGSWRLRLYSGLDIEPSAYVRTRDGFVTTMHEVVREAAMGHHVMIFNPGSNRAQRSRLRLINPTGEEVEVTIEGRDDAGAPGRAGAVRLTLAPGQARAVGALEFETGGEGFTGSLGDGYNKWQLFVSADRPIHVMSLLQSPTGHLSNLSAPGIESTVATGVSTKVPAPRLGQSIKWRNNTAAENILDHWNHPEVLREAMELSGLCGANAVTRRDALKRLSEMPGDGSKETDTLLRNVSPEAIEVIGQRGGVAYGQWKGGPAGTLNIELDWRFAQEIQIDVRAQFERAAKVWARRIQDDFRTYTVPKGRIFTFSESSAGGSGQGTITFTFDEDVTTDGLLIPVIATDKSPWAAVDFDISNLESDVENTEEDFQPSLAIMFVNPNNPDFVGREADTAAHEIGHALGIADIKYGEYETCKRNPYECVHNLSWLSYLNETDHTFDGPQAQKANGDEPVPLQWLDDRRHPVAPHTPGAERDTGHLGVCNSIVSYVCAVADVLIPTELDFAVLDDIGYDVLDRQTASEPELYGYAAWGRYSAWGAGVERNLQYNERNDLARGVPFANPYRGYEFATDELRAGVDAFGITPETAFSETPSSAGQGTLTWSGTLIGVDLDHEGLPPVFGNVDISMDGSTLKGMVRVHNLRVVTDGKPGPFRTRELQYDISLTGNDFADDDGRIAGSLFGPGHEEMGATIHDASSGVNLLAVLVVSTEPIPP